MVQNDANLSADQTNQTTDVNSGLPAPSAPVQPVQQTPPVAIEPQSVLPSAPAPSLGVKNSSDSPTVAEDVDLIEKEWVIKAKNIVSKTKNDPSQQNIELNKFKADYLNTRFNKTIKPMDG